MGAIGMLRFDAGEIVEHWATLDLLGLLQQLGAAPAQADLLYEARWPASARASDPNGAADMALVRRFFDEVCNARRLDIVDCRLP